MDDIITPKKFFLDIPLYEKIAVQRPSDLVYHYKTFEGYNPVDKIETTYVVSGSINEGENSFNTATLTCKRTGTWFQFYFFWDVDEHTLEKVGQYPSVATFHTHEIKQYKSLLSEEKMREFTRAMGLVSHGVGIGSFVYLRRIFEYLIWQAFDVAKANGDGDEKIFATTRMDEKIDLLKNYLPDFLLEHKVMYSILSKGIHELNEQICLAAFEPLRLGIEMILDEKLIAIEKEQKRKAASERIKQLPNVIK